jgi:hypothetical protein
MNPLIRRVIAATTGLLLGASASQADAPIIRPETYAQLERTGAVHPAGIDERLAMLFMAQMAVSTIGGSTELLPAGQIIYGSPLIGSVLARSYTWTVPSGVFSICILVVGGGGTGDDGNSGDGGGGGGGGGGSGYANNIPVMPGWTVNVNIGQGGNNGNGKSAVAAPGVLTSFRIPNLGNWGLNGGAGGGGAPYGANPASQGGMGAESGTRPAGVTVGFGDGGKGGGGYNGGGGGGGGAGAGDAGSDGKHSILSASGTFPSNRTYGGGGGGPISNPGMQPASTSVYGGKGGNGRYDATGGGGGGAATLSTAKPPMDGGPGNQRQAASSSQGGFGGWPGGGGGGSYDDGYGIAQAGADGMCKIIWGADRFFPASAWDTKLTVTTGPSIVTDVFAAKTFTQPNAVSVDNVIKTGVDLSSGGVFWVKERVVAQPHRVLSPMRSSGPSHASITTSTSAAPDAAVQLSFQDDGLTILGTTGSLTGINQQNSSYASWSFKNQSRFFTSRLVYHANNTVGTTTDVDLSILGTVGMVFVKGIDGSPNFNWFLLHRNFGNWQYLNVNATSALMTGSTDSVPYISGTTLRIPHVFTSGIYEVWGWAHDAAADGIIQTAVVPINAAGNVTVALPWPIQFLMTRYINVTDNLNMLDTSRDFTSTGGRYVSANLNTAETATTNIRRDASGFSIVTNSTANTGNCLYLAIRDFNP